MRGTHTLGESATRSGSRDIYSCCHQQSRGGVPKKAKREGTQRESQKGNNGDQKGARTGTGSKWRRRQEDTQMKKAGRREIS